MVTAVVDNDVLLKGAIYGFLEPLVTSMPCEVGKAGALGAARFVVLKRLEKHPLNKPREEAIEGFKQTIQKMQIVEPTIEETALASEIEAAAQIKGLPVDSGESQLLSITIVRALSYIATGDKRAIISFEELCESSLPIDEAKNKVICLEQLVAKLIQDATQFFSTRNQVCLERQTDKALSISMFCHRETAAAEECLQALNSYIEDLRRAAPQLLVK